jgi:hypothetical protein
MMQQDLLILLQLEISGTTHLQDFTTPLAASSASGTLKYTTPELTDGLTLVGSYSPKGTTTASGTAVGYGLNYSGIDGLTVNLAKVKTMEQLVQKLI